MSVLTIFSNWREGWQLSGFALNLFPRRAALILFVALAFELGALFMSRKATLPRRCAYLVGGVLGAAFISLYAVTLRFDPLEAIQTTRGVGRLGEIRGHRRDRR